MNQIYLGLKSPITSLVAIICLLCGGYANQLFAQETSKVNYHFYVVHTTDKSLYGMSAKLDSAFAKNGYVEVKTNEQTAQIKITAPKARRIEDVKAVLTSFGLSIVSYEEEYGQMPSKLFEKR